MEQTLVQNLPDAAAREASRGPAGQEVLLTLVTLTRLHGVPVTPAMLLDEAGVSQEAFTFKHAVQVLKALGFKSSWVQADSKHLNSAFCPMVLEIHSTVSSPGRCLIASRIRGNIVTVIEPLTQLESDLLVSEIHSLGRVLLVAPPPMKARSVDWIDRIQGADWFWGSLLRHRRTLVEGILLTVVINVLAIAMSIFTMSVYDRVLPNAAFTTLWALALGVGIAMLFEFAARTVRTHALDKVGKKMDLTLGSIVFRQVLMLRLEKQQGSSSGSMAQVIREYESVRDFVTSATLTVLADLPFMLLFFAVIAYIGGPLAYVPIGGAVLLVIVLIAMQFPLQRLMSEQMRQGAARTGLVVESIAALDSLKSLRAESLIVRQHDRLAAESAQIGLRTRTITSFVTNFYGFLQQACTVALLTWGVYLVAEGKATSGVLIASVILMGRAMQPLSAIAGLASRFQGARTALKALNNIMKSPREREPGLNYFHRSHWEGHLHLHDVSFKYSNDLPDVVQKCSLEIKPGERVGIIGRMGSGKSTLLRLMAGLYQTTAGEVMMDGQDLRHVDVSDVRRCIRMLTQDVRLMRGSLMENLRLAAPHASDDLLMKAAQDAGVADFARTHPLGLNMPVGEGGQMLSGGQRQAVALAQVLLADARLLLLDEPTASMDQFSENAIYKALEQASKGRTLVLVTHKGSLLGLVERLVVVDQGRIVMDGKRDEVLKRLSGMPNEARNSSAPANRARPQSGRGDHMNSTTSLPAITPAKPQQAQVELLAPSAKSLPFADPVLEASQDDRHHSWIATAVLMIALLGSLGVWAYHAVIEQVASGPGRAIAAEREQVIQSLEGGILTEVLVREGDQVNAGDPLVQLDPIRAQSSYGEGRSKLLALKATAARLVAEANEQPAPNFDADVRADKELVARERSTLEARRQTMLQVVSAQRRTRDLLQREIAITEPMVNQGLVAEVELLRLKRQSSEIEGQIAERINRFKSEANSELVKVMGEISQVSELLVAKQDQVERTVIRAPIRGTVKNVRITTRGGVIQPGQDILEIVPWGDNLLVEAKIRPSDIAFMQVGQKATVKISAYDPQLYGSLEGRVEFISPDTLLEEKSQQQETYYKVIVRTDMAVLHHNGKELPVLPGMTATVDIKTGTTTVANSVIKPVLRLKEAFRER